MPRGKHKDPAQHAANVLAYYHEHKHEPEFRERMRQYKRRSREKYKKPEPYSYVVAQWVKEGSDHGKWRDNGRRRREERAGKDPGLT